VSSCRFSQAINWCLPLVPFTLRATATAPQKVLYRSTRLPGDTQMMNGSSDVRIALIKRWLLGRLAFDHFADGQQVDNFNNCQVIATQVDAGWELKLIALKNIGPWTRLCF
jgi:hypothetical protein